MVKLANNLSVMEYPSYWISDAYFELSQLQRVNAVEIHKQKMEGKTLFFAGIE